LASKAIEFGEKHKIRAITTVRVIQGHRDRYQCGKPVCDFLLVIIELLLLYVTTEALRAKIDQKSAILLQRGQFDPKFQVEGDVPTNHFCMDS